MAANKYIANIAGKLKEVFGTVISAGVANANQIPALDSTGRLDISLMPIGVDVEVVVAATSENLTAGDFVNLFVVGAAITLRKADSTTNAKPAHGFVIANTISPASATMYILGVRNSYVVGLTVGSRYFLDKAVPGGLTVTAPSVAGNIVQEIAIATLTTEVLTFDNQNYIEIA